MNLSISRSELKTAVTGLSRIIPNRVTLPILGGVRFAADENGTVTASATDLDQTAVYRFVNTTSVDVGTFVLPLTPLKELTKGDDRERVEFKTTDQQIQITNHVGGHAIRFAVNTLPAEEWPEPLKPVPCKPAEGFLETYRRLLPFASTDQTRYALTNVFIDINGKGERPVCMFAVDGKRLCVWNSMAFDLKSSVPIPVPSSRFLAWNGLTGKVEIGLREEITPKRGKNPEIRKAWFGVQVGSSWQYTTKVPEVSAPSYRNIIPDYTADQVQRCRFTDKDVDALRKILPTFPGHDSYNKTVVLVGGQDGRLTVCGRDQDATADTVLTLEGGSSYEGKGGQIGMNREYLLDALKAGFRMFSYVDATTPLRGEDGRGGTYVLMPVRVDHEVTAKPVTSVPEAVPPPVAEVTETVPAVVAGETNKETAMTEKTEEVGALDKVLAAVETARGKLKDAVLSLSEVTDAVKVAVREGKTQAVDLEKARATLQKLQAISL
jgi:DNA polymerase III sliding clamp (beta) subunit (PCNA family)